MVLAWNTNSRLQVDEVGDDCASPVALLSVSPGLGVLDSSSDRLQRSGQEHLDSPKGDDDDSDDDDTNTDRNDEFEDDDFDEDEFDDTDEEEEVDEDLDEDDDFYDEEEEDF